MIAIQAAAAVLVILAVLCMSLIIRWGSARPAWVDIMAWLTLLTSMGMALGLVGAMLLA